MMDVRWRVLRIEAERKSKGGSELEGWKHLVQEKVRVRRPGVQAQRLKEGRTDHVKLEFIPVHQVVVDAVAGSHHCLLAQLERDPDTGRKVVQVVGHDGAGNSGVLPHDFYGAGFRVKKFHLVVDLDRRGVQFVSKTKVQRHARMKFPIILDVETHKNISQVLPRVSHRSRNGQGESKQVIGNSAATNLRTGNLPSLAIHAATRELSGEAESRVAGEVGILEVAVPPHIAA